MGKGLLRPVIYFWDLRKGIITCLRAVTHRQIKKFRDMSDLFGRRGIFGGVRYDCPNFDVADGNAGGDNNGNYGRAVFYLSAFEEAEFLGFGLHWGQSPSSFTCWRVMV